MDRAILVIRGTLLGDEHVDIVVEGNRITSVSPSGREAPPADARRIDGTRTAVLPGLMNAHTHTAMALLRGYADDMPLMPWLQEKIWPFEAKLTEADVYWGTRLGCLEMLRTGTTFFNDMYWHSDGVIRAAADSGMRAQIAGVLIDHDDAEISGRQREHALAALDAVERLDTGGRVRAALGPHAIYTVGEDLLRWTAETSAARNVPVHTHLSETAREVADCVEQRGMRPVAWLDEVGLLNERLLAAHCVHLNDDEIDRLADCGVHPLHNPVSNLKLASGGPMRYRAMRRAGLDVLVGTDGSASNNNLDLFEDLKFAALLAKHVTGDPTTLPATEALDMATRRAARAFGVDGGEIAPGRLADLILIDRDHPLIFPAHDLAADAVYSAGGRAVRTTICDGQVLMEDGVIPDEEEIRREARARLERLLQ